MLSSKPLHHVKVISL